MPPPRPATPRVGPPKVALLIETSNAYARGLLAGIERYIRSGGPWDVYLTEHGRGDEAAWLPHWRGDGILARVENENIAEALRPMEIPVVDLSSFHLLPDSPAVTTDNEQIAMIAFQHFAERGFRNFAFCGVERFPWSVARGEHFQRCVRGSGKECAVYREVPGNEGDLETDDIAAWLRDLPRPVGVFTAYDVRGRHVLAACRRAGLSVPEEVAVLGVDNDELICALAPRPLSSVIPDTQRAGWCAAELLDGMMAGQNVQPEVQCIPPLGVATRQSTDTLAVDDPRIAGALRYIREHATAGIGVGDVLTRFPMARRAFEKSLKKLIGRSPQEEIRRVQMSRARELLSGTKLRLDEIAEKCGFRHPEYLTVVFKRLTGMSPRDFRKRHGPDG
jgi:LacI family transcriptional regulator